MEKFAKGGMFNRGLFIENVPDLCGSFENPIIPHCQSIPDSIRNAVVKSLFEKKGNITVLINGKENP